MSTQSLWRFVFTSALLATAICVAGFVYGVNQILYPQPAAAGEPAAEAPVGQKKPESLTDKSKINIVALGDSLTAGTGDLSGKGYVGGVRDKLEKQTGKPVFVYNNYAIPGYRTADVLKDLDAKKDIAKALTEADVIMLTIGGNDIFQGGQDVFEKEGEGLNTKGAEERLPDALKRLDQILSFVAKQNSAAPILYVGLYHPFLDLDPNKEGSLLVDKWNSSAFAIANRFPNMTVVPTYDLFSLNLNKYLYSDHFHPNQDGYDRISDRIAQILK